MDDKSFSLPTGKVSKFSNLLDFKGGFIRRHFAMFPTLCNTMIKKCSILRVTNSVGSSLSV